MEFKRINSGTVRCIVDQEDMVQYDIKVEDFFKNSENLHEFLHMIVERAVEEVGYEPKDLGSLSMQIMPLPQNRLAITLSENTATSFSDILDNIKETISDMDTDIANELGRIEQAMKAKENRLKTRPDELCIISFENYEVLTGYAASLKDVQGIMSSLYHNRNSKEYILVLRKGRASKERFEKALDNAADYGKFVSDREVFAENVKEYLDCIIKTKAINTISELA